MNPRLTTVGTIAALVAALSACTAAPPPTAAAGSKVAATSAVTAPATTAATADGRSDTLAPASTSSPAASATRPAATVVLAVPPLPAHLPPVRPANTAAAHDAHDHDHDEDGGPVDDAGLAAVWVAAVYTGRFDQPDDALAAAGQLAADSALAATAVGALAGLDADQFEVRWPVVVKVADDGDGWWRVTFVVKHTRRGQVGPTTSGTEVAQVHVTDGRIDGWEPPA